MNIYKRRECYELDVDQFIVGSLYILKTKRNKHIVCCIKSSEKSVDFIIIETLEGYASYKGVHLEVNDYDPDLEINKVLLEENSVGQICLREEKDLLSDLADKLYQRGAVRDDCEA